MSLLGNEGSQRESRPPMIENKAQNQTREGNGNAYGVLDRSMANKGTKFPDGIEGIGNNRVRVHWKPIDWDDASRKGETIHTDIHRLLLIQINNPDYCPRPVYMLYPDFVTEQIDDFLQTHNSDQEISWGVFAKEVIYRYAELKSGIMESEKTRNDDLEILASEMENPLGERQLSTMGDLQELVDQMNNSSSSSSSSSDDDN